MKHLFSALTLSALTISAPVYAQTLPTGSGSNPQGTIQPKYRDYVPHDGYLDAGSYANPYQLNTPDGRHYEVSPRYPDYTPHDGKYDAGSYSNPYQLRQR